MFEQLKQLLAPIRYWNELPLRELADRPATVAPGKGKIPPVVIQTWEDRLFGKNHLREMAKFRDLNPELSFILWDRDQRLAYLRQNWGSHPIFEIYQKSLFGPMRTDIFRYCLMADQGGFYFDISKGCTVPLKTLYGPETEALITFEPHTSPVPCPPSVAPHLRHPDKLMLQWGFGFAPGHPIPLQTIANICAEYPRYQGKVFAFPKDAIRELTGPIMFTKSVHDVYARGPLTNVVQAGVDFDGHGVFALKGSKVRYMTVPAYTKAKHQPIVL
jgi:mannosyltransferase OCH1-like enzyme